MDVYILIGTVIALVLIYAFISHKKKRAKILELRRQIREEQRRQELKDKCKANYMKKRISMPQQNYDIDYDYYRLKELREERDAYDDYIASLDMS